MCASLPPQQLLAFPTAPTAQLPCLSVKTTCVSSRFGSATEKTTVSMALMRSFTCAVRGRGVGGTGTALLGNLLGAPQGQCVNWQLYHFAQPVLVISLSLLALVLQPQILKSTILSIKTVASMEARSAHICRSTGCGLLCSLLDMHLPLVL